jgi:pyruvate/2-oxoglutarate dehydrogenase complex dihydrolipoamide acyltransferase (E2) component
MVFETSKTTYDVEAEADGYIWFFCEVGNDYEVNAVVAKIADELSELEIAPQAKLVIKDAAQNGRTHAAAAGIKWEGETIFSAAASRLIASSGADPLLFKGKDFVDKTDVEEVLGIKPKQILQQAATAAVPVAKTKPVQPVDHTKVIAERLSSGKKREIEYLSDIQSAGLTSTINTFIETGGIFINVNPSFKYLKNSLLPLLLYETARLLKKYPLLNAYFAGDQVAVYKEVNIGFAVDIDKGLKVLKIPAADKMELSAIEEAIMDLSGKYLDDKLDITDLTDISFTITDLSAEGVTFFRPLINTMNSAILGVSSIDEQLNRCMLSITFDHRVTEGKTVARFLKELKERMESYRPGEIYKTKIITCFKCDTTLEDDLTDVGFAACIKPDGQTGYICQRCFKGF